MHGIGLEEDVRMWFPFKVPKPTVKRDRIARALQQSNEFDSCLRWSILKISMV